ncbi:MAG: glycosyl amidation-associated protein WbuZ [Anaerolineae bacterium]|nr:glycosyl amidation-associated protein WbuZ [Anaerolineae bacterium]
MLKTRLIPVLLLKNGRMVKTIQFDKLRDVGHPVKAAMVYDAQNVDELIFLDITATEENRSTFFDVIQQVTEESFMPFTAGGGLRTVDDIRALLNAGADKVTLNTEAVRRPEFITEAADRFGNQCIVVSIDARRVGYKKYEVYINRGREATGLNPAAWAQQAVLHGAGEIMITSIDHEGTMEGFDLELIQQVTSAVAVPVIAHGGAGTPEHFVEAVRDAGAHAVAAASIFHFTDQNPIKARAHMKRAGLDVRR